MTAIDRAAEFLRVAESYGVLLPSKKASRAPVSTEPKSGCAFDGVWTFAQQ